jgi:hypothetical protein
MQIAARRAQPPPSEPWRSLALAPGGSKSPNPFKAVYVRVQIRRAADETRTRCEGIHHLARSDPGGHAFGIRSECDIGIPVRRQASAKHLLEFLREIGKCFCVGGEALFKRIPPARPSMAARKCACLIGIKNAGSSGQPRFRLVKRTSFAQRRTVGLNVSCLFGEP